MSRSWSHSCTHKWTLSSTRWTERKSCSWSWRSCADADTASWKGAVLISDVQWQHQSRGLHFGDEWARWKRLIWWLLHQAFKRRPDSSPDVPWLQGTSQISFGRVLENGRHVQKLPLGPFLPQNQMLLTWQSCPQWATVELPTWTLLQGGICSQDLQSCRNTAKCIPRPQCDVSPPPRLYIYYYHYLGTSQAQCVWLSCLSAGSHFWCPSEPQPLQCSQ